MNRLHLDDRALDRLGRDELDEQERRELAAHLGGGCPECERYLETLDPEREQLLIGLCLERSTGDGRPRRLSSDEKARMFEELESRLGDDREPPSLPSNIKGPRPGRRALALAAGALLALTISFAAIRQWPRPIEKGAVEITGGPVFLQFLVVGDPDEPGAPPRVRRGVNRATYPDSDRLMFRYQIDHPARVYLARVGPDGAAEYLYPPGDDAGKVRRAGFHDANRGDQALVYPLAGLSGLQTFCALALADEQEDHNELLQIVGGLLHQNDQQDMISRIRTDVIDCFQVKVDKEWRQ